MEPNAILANQPLYVSLLSIPFLCKTHTFTWPSLPGHAHVKFNTSVSS